MKNKGVTMSFKFVFLLALTTLGLTACQGYSTRTFENKTNDNLTGLKSDLGHNYTTYYPKEHVDEVVDEVFKGKSSDLLF